MGMAYNGSVIFKSNNYRVMTVIIDQNNEDPEKCCTYADDALNMVPGSSEWDDFFGHYPVMLKNGVEGKKLNRNNFNKYEDGTTADTETGNEGDVMIACPRRGIRISTDENNIISISMTDNPNDPNFEYNAHRRNNEQKDIFYVGAYEAILIDDGKEKLRSLSGDFPLKDKSLSQFRNLAQANGKSNGTSSGYEVMGWFQQIFRQVMYLLKFKNLDSQSTIGYGNVGSGQSRYDKTGYTNTWGMDSEIEKKKNPNNFKDMSHHVKCLGWEDMWGEDWELIEGIYTDSNRKLKLATTNFNDNGSGYENMGSKDYQAGYISKIYGTTKTGFIPIEGNGSEKTYYTDTALAFYPDAHAVISGNYLYDETKAGIFFLINQTNYSSKGNSFTSARLMYL